MATVQSTLALQDRMSSTLSSITKAMHSTLNAMKAIKGENLGKTLDVTSQEIIEAERHLADFNNQLKNMHEQSSSNNSSLGGTVKRVISITAALAGMKKVMDMSDTYSQTQSRLNLITREGENVVDINNKIYASAQKSKTGYVAMQASVAKLGQTAGKAFGSTDEIIRFTELLNKNFIVGGTGATEQAAAMYQLTQAMGSGRLQGDEYRSIIENAPLLAKAIEDYMINVEHAKGSMKDWASEGLLTSDVIKAALFNSADEIERKYKEMPLTFAQSWTMFKNAAIRAAEPVLKIVSKVLQGFSIVFEFISEHTYIFYAFAIAVGIVGATYLLLNAKTLILAASHAILNSQMAKTALIIGGVTLLVTAFIATLFYLYNTNDEVAYAILLAWDGLQIGIGAAALGLKIAFYGILDSLSYMKISGLLIVDGFLSGIIGLINTFIGLLNKIPGVSIEAIDNTTSFAMNAAIEESEKIADRASQIQADTQSLIAKTQELNNSRNERVANRNKPGMENVFGEDLSSLIGTDAAGGKALKTTSKDDLLSDEDIQMLLDIATRDYQLNYQQVTPNIAVSFGDVRETADVDGVMDAIAVRIDEIISGDAEVKE